MAGTINSSSFNSQLGEQQFLQLMAAQLENQNPLEPMQQQDFLSQLAQFSTLSGIESLNQNFSALFQLQKLTQGASLVGKSISYLDSNNQTATGVVDAAKISNGSLVVSVNGSQVDLSSVIGVTNGSTTN